MEKILYPVWKSAEQDADDFREALLNKVAPALLVAGIRGLRISVVDNAVTPAAGLRQESLGPGLDGMLSVWVDSATTRQPLEAIIAAHCERLCGYLVTESEPLCSDTPVGARTEGMCQIVFLHRPERLSEAQWLEIWQGSHTQVAIDTQSTFGFRQNVVVRVLTDGAPPVDAIVEENFPDAAMSSPHAFYNVETDEQLQANLKAMIDSCARFIDFDRLTVVPTSEYLLK